MPSAQSARRRSEARAHAAWKNQPLCPLVRAVSSAEAVVFADRHARHLCGFGQLLRYSLEDVTGEVLPGRNELSVRELGHIEIDVAMVEAILDLLLEDLVEHAEVDDEPSLVVDGSVEDRKS